MCKKLVLLCMQICMFFSLSQVSFSAMADQPFIGEVRWFAGNFAPQDWAFCDGQILSIAENTALFSLLGTTYGGDGMSTFALPDMRGRGMVHVGAGPGLTQRTLGEKAGSETATLNTNQLPAHTHTLRADSTAGDSALVEDRVISSAGRLQVFNPVSDVDMNISSITVTGGNQSHNNIQPQIALNCIIALSGIYPARN
jgi:microcystin-dependent protein